MAQSDTRVANNLSPRLSRFQICGALAYGAVLWFAAANLLRELAPLGIYEGSARLWLYALIWPGTVPFVFLARKLFGLPRGLLGPAFAAATALATLLDGLALAWWPALYGTDSAQVAGAGATILWGAGTGMALAFWFDRSAA